MPNERSYKSDVNRTDFRIAPTKGVGTFQPTETTPVVSNVDAWKCLNVAPVLITNFRGGQEGQPIKILGDGQTSVDHGTFIFTNTGADKLLDTGLVYTFTLFDGIWYENE